MRHLPLHLPLHLLLACLLPCPVAEFARAADDDPADLVQARALYSKELEFATRPIRDRYLSRLDTLKRALGGRGDIRGALGVQEEIDRVTTVATGSFLGRWTLRYENRVVRKISIDADNETTILEEDSQPKNTKGNLVFKDGAGIVQWGDGTLEKLTVVNGKLVIEHWNPMSTYPKSPPVGRAVGTKTALK